MFSVPQNAVLMRSTTVVTLLVQFLYVAATRDYEDDKVQKDAEGIAHKPFAQAKHKHAGVEENPEFTKDAHEVKHGIGGVNDKLDEAEVWAGKVEKDIEGTGGYNERLKAVAEAVESMKAAQSRYQLALYNKFSELESKGVRTNTLKKPVMKLGKDIQRETTANELKKDKDKSGEKSNKKESQGKNKSTKEDIQRETTAAELTKDKNTSGEKSNKEESPGDNKSMEQGAQLLEDSKLQDGEESGLSKFDENEEPVVQIPVPMRRQNLKGHGQDVEHPGARLKEFSNSVEFPLHEETLRKQKRRWLLDKTTSHGNRNRDLSSSAESHSSSESMSSVSEESEQPNAQVQVHEKTRVVDGRYSREEGEEEEASEDDVEGDLDVIGRLMST